MVPQESQVPPRILSWLEALMRLMEVTQQLSENIGQVLRESTHCHMAPVGEWPSSDMGSKSCNNPDFLSINF